MAIQSSVKENRVEIVINGRFDYSQHRDFRNSYQNYTAGNIHFDVNLTQADYMDSSALGMLLLLKEHCEQHHQRGLRLLGPNPTVLKILQIANFDKLFSIEA